VTLKAGSLVNVVLPRFMALGTKGSYTTYGLDPQENALRCGESYPIPAVDENPMEFYMKKIINRSYLH
jgi:hypothetical protein